MKTLPTPYETMDNKSRLSFVKTILPFSWRWKNHYHLWYYLG